MKPPRNRAGILRLARRLYGTEAVTLQPMWIGMRCGNWILYAYGDKIMMQRSSLRSLGLALHYEMLWVERGEKRRALEAQSPGAR